MRWITREHPKIDRVACPWLITRFIDPVAEFLFAPPAAVHARAAELNAIPYDVEGVELSHDGPRCSFDAFLRKYGLTDPALQELAVIIRGPIRTGWTSHHNPPDCSPFLWACLDSSQTITTCCPVASSCMTPCMSGCGMPKASVIPGTRSACRR